MICPSFLDEKCFKDNLKMVITNSDFNFTENSIDPFSMIFDIFLGEMDLSKYIDNEKTRQRQKTLQNRIGEFQQNIITCVDGWERITVADVKNDNTKIICEVKNKYNTVNSSSALKVYDNLEKLISKEYLGYTSYFVQIIPKNKTEYNKPFTPSDNATGRRRAKNEKIRVIDGKTFYYLITENENALKEIYDYLPYAMAEVSGRKFEDIITDKKSFEKVFHNIYN